ncbi:sec-independent protein translocase protein TatA [Dehalogenimonas formicexedens]|uniref:Sec-independent protein translocase protein TatA n=1 Tax=Dehalogenimonas formicexedens TaxID=1839801 RepID=A0A1P8FAL9_9CHLR|nr:twin-arginine translocase TatA/TatE family subunit [Dehalogenimonas formicexedens]APV45490.1 sec-independent protein translocase protein TatA [Dehalogenimonas formicexedens]
MKFGPLEIILILAIILVVTGAGFAPSLGKNLGTGIRQLRQAVGGDKNKTKIVTSLHDGAAAKEINRRVFEQKRSSKAG